MLFCQLFISVKDASWSRISPGRCQSRSCSQNGKQYILVSMLFIIPANSVNIKGRKMGVLGNMPKRVNGTGALGLVQSSNSSCPKS